MTTDKSQTTDLSKSLRILAGMLSMGERISFGQDSAIMIEAADKIEELESDVKRLHNDKMELMEKYVWKFQKQ